MAFRIVLVGGGPVGLVAAHILAAAGLDFVLLEQRQTVVPLQGAGIVLFPHTQRVLEQLPGELMGRIREVAYQFSENRIVDRKGTHYDTTYTSRWCEESHGAGWLFLHRPELLKVLYDTLPDAVKAHVLPSKKVEDIEALSDGVLVRCTDGTVERGSIVVGADGVHSRVRACMQRPLRPISSHPDNDGRLVSTYRCLYGNTERIPGLELGPEWDLHSSGTAMQLFGTENGSWFLFYDKLSEPTQKRQKYSDDDIAALASRVADIYVTDKVQFKDVWNARKWVMLADLPEGTQKEWHTDRIVLVGDAASKQTPNIGQGWNCGVQDVVVLTNQLVKFLRSKADDTKEGTECLTDVFRTYQDIRRPSLEVCIQVAGGATRAATWDSWLEWWKDRYLTPWKGGGKTAFQQGMGAIISKGKVLDFIPEQSHLIGSIPWEKSTDKVDRSSTMSE